MNANTKIGTFLALSAEERSPAIVPGRFTKDGAKKKKAMKVTTANTKASLRAKTSNGEHITFTDAPKETFLPLLNP
jgi:hypothetical protein